MAVIGNVIKIAQIIKKGIAPITGPMPLHFPAAASGHQYSSRRISCGCCVRRDRFKFCVNVKN
jgi:hypothetical protein